MIFVVALTCLTGYLAVEAMTTTEPLQFSKELILAAGDAKLFYGAWSLVLDTGSVLGIAAVIGTARNPGLIVPEKSVAMISNASPMQEMIRIRYRDLRKPGVVKDSGTERHIELRTDDSASNIGCSKFGNDEAFEEVWNEPDTRVSGSAFR